jgi:hypothetical protein
MMESEAEMIGSLCMSRRRRERRGEVCWSCGQALRLMARYLSFARVTSDLQRAGVVTNGRHDRPTDDSALSLSRIK